MQQNAPLKKAIRSIFGEFIVLIAPGTMSTLHLASMQESPPTKEKRKLFKLSRKMLKIIAKLPLDNIEFDDKYNSLDNNIKLFYAVYNKREYLTLNELRTLYDFCTILRNLAYYCIIKDINDKGERDIYNQYSENIYNLIELKKTNKKKKQSV